jgi:hypothetical protein
MLSTIKGTLAAAVAASSGTFTATVPMPGADLKSFQEMFGRTAGSFYGAMGHSLVIGNNQPLTYIRDFTVTLTNQSTLTITNKTSSAWPAGAAFILQLDQRGQRYYQDNDPVFARKTMPFALASLALINLGMPATASNTAIVGTAAFGTTTSAAGTEKLTAPVYNDVPRAVSITSSSASDTSAYTCKVTGTDVFGQTMSELLTFNGAATVNGNKAFATVTSVKAIHASGTALNGSVSVGTTTKLGLPVFVPSAGFVVKEILDGAVATSGTFAYGITTAGGSTTTTGDVRGTYIPNTAPDGAKTYELLVAVADPGCIGIPQA